MHEIWGWIMNAGFHIPNSATFALFRACAIAPIAKFSTMRDFAWITQLDESVHVCVQSTIFGPKNFAGDVEDFWRTPRSSMLEYLAICCGDNAVFCLFGRSLPVWLIVVWNKPFRWSGWLYVCVHRVTEAVIALPRRMFLPIKETLFDKVHFRCLKFVGLILVLHWGQKCNKMTHHGRIQKNFNLNAKQAGKHWLCSCWSTVTLHLPEIHGFDSLKQRSFVWFQRLLCFHMWLPNGTHHAGRQTHQVWFWASMDCDISLQHSLCSLCCRILFHKNKIMVDPVICFGSLLSL